MPDLDVAWAAELAGSCATAYREYLGRPPTEIGQAEHAIAGDYAFDAGLLVHALGAPPDETRLWLRRAVTALARVFRAQGTGRPLPMDLVAGEEAAVTGGPVAPDLSLTNPRRAALALYLALVIGAVDLADELARMISSTAGNASADASPADSQVAAALAALLTGRRAVAAYELAQPDLADPTHHQVRALSAVVDADRSAFLAAMDEVLATHAVWAADEEQLYEPRRLVCVAGLGLAALAVDSGMIALHDLPADDPCLPLIVIASRAV